MKIELFDPTIFPDSKLLLMNAEMKEHFKFTMQFISFYLTGYGNTKSYSKGYKHWVYLLINNKKIVGFSYFYYQINIKTCQISQIYIEPSQRRKDFAKELVLRSIYKALDADMKKVHINFFEKKSKIIDAFYHMFIKLKKEFSDSINISVFYTADQVYMNKNLGKI